MPLILCQLWGTDQLRMVWSLVPQTKRKAWSAVSAAPFDGQPRIRGHLFAAVRSCYSASSACCRGTAHPASRQRRQRHREPGCDLQIPCLTWGSRRPPRSGHVKANRSVTAVLSGGQAPNLSTVETVDATYARKRRSRLCSDCESQYPLVDRELSRETCLDWP